MNNHYVNSNRGRGGSCLSQELRIAPPEAIIFILYTNEIINETEGDEQKEEIENNHCNITSEECSQEHDNGFQSGLFLPARVPNTPHGDTRFTFCSEPTQPHASLHSPKE